MNRGQKIALVVVMVTMVVMLLFPPFYGYRVERTNLGYGFLFLPPATWSATGSVDIGMLLTQWVGVLAVGGLAVFMLKD